MASESVSLPGSVPAVTLVGIMERHFPGYRNQTNGQLCAYPKYNIMDSGERSIRYNWLDNRVSPCSDGVRCDMHGVRFVWKDAKQVLIDQMNLAITFSLVDPRGGGMPFLLFFQRLHPDDFCDLLTQLASNCTPPPASGPDKLDAVPRRVDSQQPAAP